MGSLKKPTDGFDCEDLGTNTFSFLILPKFKSNLPEKFVSDCAPRALGDTAC